MTVRQVFYQLVVRNVIEKTEEQYQRTVIRLLTEMRMGWQAGLHLSVRRLGSERGVDSAIPRTPSERDVRAADCPPPIVERVALTEDHIVEFNLPTRPTKREGNRHAKNFEGDSVELDALPANELRAMVRKVIERHISQRDLEVLRAAEESDRFLLEAWADKVGEE
jgi:hypothetical protein